MPLSLKEAAGGACAGPSGPASSVYLVGVGPGDVELLTVKALRLMRDADLVLYDRLISPEVLSMVGPQAAMLYVGKEAGLHTRPQEEIHRLLHLYAHAGKSVVRLKGGDPTVFGRGGEELEYLEARGVPVQIVPGITAASGIAAALRVPLTHRDYADSVRFVTGHARSENSAPVAERYRWEVLSDPSQTLVVYMGLSTLPQFADGLLQAGLDASTPAVAVQDGTTATQRVVAAPLGGLATAVEEASLASPTLVVIGRVEARALLDSLKAGGRLR
ncbi:uroporphyrin-III C-methyltransferase [Emiliania huxleyi CCMP1516]|uniref:uroporphyrinogen-III C-methyltransferase n=2 Tax=Emiliania huxleyi TaxID=2903 RepID=A0A0D3IMG6_EMIH1|nr:uroporphyrin-III C-methyltransferase [Emiliania huxleyi CCMP1516]EOD12451.1 uroporphyrin-III C-methyltransferase [Emiliania huxleyi CCMP1516]|eukprot:XP_005764880.1 uroporphyrin-III C-methyltransferase [Emiliania huxleyi CCMP1516]